MKKTFYAALAWLVMGGAALAQSQLGAGQVMGNSTAAQRPARAESVTAILDRALGSTRGAILERGASNWAIVGPGTTGRPWVSNGAGADPAYQVLGIAGGGTNCSAASGTCLDNITGFASTGVINRTGAGTYSFITPAALTKTDDTNVTVTLGGTPASALLAATSITMGWTGTLSIARGGTGGGTQQAAINAIHNCPPTRAGDITYYNGANWVCLAGNNTGTRVLQEDSAGLPSWVAAGAGTVTSVTLGAGYGISVSGTNPVTTTGTFTPAVGLSTFSASLGSNTAVNTASYTIGAQVAQGSTGTWLAIANVTFVDSATAQTLKCRITDGATAYGSSAMTTGAAALVGQLAFSAFVPAPVGNIRVECQNTSGATTNMLFNQSGNGFDTSIRVLRIS